MEDYLREVDVNLTSAYQGDSGAGEYSFSLKRVINGVDISTLNPYLKIRFADESTDKLVVALDQLESDRVTYTFSVSSAFTRRAGRATCQLVFESSDGETCINSAKFSVEIFDSVEVDGYGETQVPSVIRELQIELNEMLDELRSDFDGGKPGFTVNQLSPYSGNRVTVKVPAVGGVAGMQKVVAAGETAGVVGSILLGDGGGEIKVKNASDEDYNSVLKVKNDKILMESKGSVEIKSEGDVSFNCPKAVIGAVKMESKTLSHTQWSNNSLTLSLSSCRATDGVIVAPVSNGGIFYQSGIYCSSVGENTVVLSCSAVPTVDIDVRIFVVG